MKKPKELPFPKQLFVSQDKSGNDVYYNTDITIESLLGIDPSTTSIARYELVEVKSYKLTAIETK